MGEVHNQLPERCVRRWIEVHQFPTLPYPFSIDALDVSQLNLPWPRIELTKLWWYKLLLLRLNSNYESHLWSEVEPIADGLGQDLLRVVDVVGPHLGRAPAEVFNPVCLTNH